MVRLPGHRLPVLSAAITIEPQPNESNQPITLTIVLKRDDQARFEKYLHEIYDPHSKNFHRYLTQRQISKRFGPSLRDYTSVLRYLQKNGFTLIRGSKNRLTLTVRASRRDAETAFAIRIGHYRIGQRQFYANDNDPALPSQLASKVKSISGLSSLAIGERVKIEDFDNACTGAGIALGVIPEVGTVLSFWVGVECFVVDNFVDFFDALNATPGSGYHCRFCLEQPFGDKTSATSIVSGTGQTVGLLEFDSYQTSDVSDYLNLLSLVGSTPAPIGNLSQVPVNGGVSPPGSDQDEVLLDIETVMTYAPGTKVVVYDAPFNGAQGYTDLFNAMIDGGVTIISNSWASCEDQISLADAKGIDTVLQNAAAAGISVFNGTGDDGSTCLDGAANTISVPADSPNATAVGGSSIQPGPGYTYGSETWWGADGGQNGGGFGTSKFFSAPSYQSGLSGGANRSIPDVVINADPESGMIVCEASNGGCPNGLLYGGTSLAAPLWASFAAQLNQAQGSNLGFLNPLIYPLSASNGFHNAASMSSDFAHVGLGSPNLDALHLLLTKQTAGLPSAANSQVVYSSSIVEDAQVPAVSLPADGTSQGVVVVRLVDANGNIVSGKTVSLAPTGGSAKISPVSATSSVNDGTAVFMVTDLTPEPITLKATDSTDSIDLTETASVSFVTPVAAAAGLMAGPSEVTANGTTPADITVTLQDSLGRPTPGKLIQISQTGGNSVISGPNPPITDASGQIEFTAVDSNNETVTYSAVDVTDGNLAFPQTGTVTFSDAPEAGCSNTFIAAPGFVAQPYATGFVSQNFCVDGICNSGCPGAFGVAFDASGNLYVSDQPTGDVYKIPPGGGVANSSSLLTQTAIPTLIGLVVDGSGNLYAGVNEAGSLYAPGGGEVVKIDTSTGAIASTVASGLTCPGLIAIDPLSGDLFADDNCSGNAGGGALNNATLWRISNPAGTPSVSVYTTLPGSPNGTEAFAPGGTIYIPTDGGGSTLAVISGTNGPTTPTVSTLTGLPLYGLGLLAMGSETGGAAEYLISSFDPIGNIPGGIGTFDLTTTPVSQSSTLVTNGPQAPAITIGPDGCLYAARGVAVFRITDTTGACTYAAQSPAASLYLSPIGISPNPAQGTSQTFTAQFHNVDASAGTPVSFSVSGANPQGQVANTDASGVSSFTYTAAHAGTDTIKASSTVDAVNVSSNQGVVTWGSGSHVTFVNLNNSPTTGFADQSVSLSAILFDESVTPPFALSGQQLTLAIDSSSCVATTNSNGVGSCSVTAGAGGSSTLSASFAGAAGYDPSSASEGFKVIASIATTATATVTATPTATAKPTATATATETATPTASPTPVTGKLKVTPHKLNFGEIEVGTNRIKSVEVINAGKIKKKKIPLPILIEMETGVTSPFSVTQACDDDDLGPKGKGMPAGRCKISVMFAPTAAMKYQGTLVIDDNLEPSFEKSVQLEGSGKEQKK